MRINMWYWGSKTIETEMVVTILFKAFLSLTFSHSISLLFTLSLSLFPLTLYVLSHSFPATPHLSIALPGSSPPGRWRSTPTSLVGRAIPSIANSSPSAPRQDTWWSF